MHRSTARRATSCDPGRNTRRKKYLFHAFSLKTARAAIGVAGCLGEQSRRPFSCMLVTLTRKPLAFAYPIAWRFRPDVRPRDERLQRRRSTRAEHSCAIGKTTSRRRASGSQANREKRGRPADIRDRREMHRRIEGNGDRVSLRDQRHRRRLSVRAHARHLAAYDAHERARRAARLSCSGCSGLISRMSSRAVSRNRRATCAGR
jgi:hypothetical protein